MRSRRNCSAPSASGQSKGRGVLAEVAALAASFTEPLAGRCLIVLIIIGFDRKVAESRSCATGGARTFLSNAASFWQAPKAAHDATRRALDR